MAIRVDPTPNPAALKFTLETPVGGPKTYTADSGDMEPYAEELLAIDGVVSVFATADFVTVTKSEAGDWDAIRPAATGVLERHFETSSGS